MKIIEEKEAGEGLCRHDDFVNRSYYRIWLPPGCTYDMHHGLGSSAGHVDFVEFDRDLFATNLLDDLKEEGKLRTSELFFGVGKCWSYLLGVSPASNACFALVSHFKATEVVVLVCLVLRG